jgi:hypothetical protein
VLTGERKSPRIETHHKVRELLTQKEAMS